LPDQIVAFDRPPVVEVVAAVSFDGLSNDQSAYLGAFWKDMLRDRYPTFQNQGRYEPTVEQFDDAAFAVNQFTFTAGLPQPRLWASSLDGQQLLQLQPDWFACNWRKVKPHDEYDRWPARREAFAHWFAAFARYIEAEGLGPIKVTQAEVTYINHIRAGRSAADLGRFGSIFTLGPAGLETSPEQVTLNTQFRYQVADDQYGRVRVTVNPALSPQGEYLYNFELTARGPVAGGDLLSALTFMDHARAQIDRTFVAMTTAEIQKSWGRTL
jgi:uncharacterized protein (TIGR04255 family)